VVEASAQDIMNAGFNLADIHQHPGVLVDLA
jgi:hypothetical protein